MRVPDEQLTENFWLREFCVSSKHPGVAARLTPSPYHISCVRLLCESILQPVRDHAGRTDILSGFRNGELNVLVDGEDDSDHLIAAAADFTTEWSLWRLYHWIIWKKLPYRQLIYYSSDGFIHGSINIPGKPYKHEHWIEK